MRKATGKPEAGDAGDEVVPADNPNPEVPVFDRATEDLPWPQDETLPADDEGNILWTKIRMTMATRSSSIPKICASARIPQLGPEISASRI